MTVARHYIMTAKQGGSAQLETALSNLAATTELAGPGVVRCAAVSRSHWDQTGAMSDSVRPKR